MKWLGFIALVLIESLAIFGLSLEQIGFTIQQAILISCYVVLLIITITGFIIIQFVNLQKERENEFRILVEKLRGLEEVIKRVKEEVIEVGDKVVIVEEKVIDVKRDIKEIVWGGLKRLVAEVLSPLLSLLFSLSESPILGK